MSFLDYAGKKARWGGLDQSSTPDRHEKTFHTELQDSRNYNPQSVHLRNTPHGGYQAQNTASSTIGVVLQPKAANGVNGHQNGNG